MIQALIVSFLVVLSAINPSVEADMRAIEKAHGLNLGEIHRDTMTFEDGSVAEGWQLGTNNCGLRTNDNLLPWFGGPDTIIVELDHCVRLFLPYGSK